MEFEEQTFIRLGGPNEEALQLIIIKIINFIYIATFLTMLL